MHKHLKEFDYKHFYGEFSFYPCKFAIGFGIQKLTCDNMGWLLRFYLGPLKLWVHFGGQRAFKLKGIKPDYIIMDELK